MPSFGYDDHSDITWEQIGEAVTHKQSIDLSTNAKHIAVEKLTIPMTLYPISFTAGRELGEENCMLLG